MTNAGCLLSAVISEAVISELTDQSSVILNEKCASGELRMCPCICTHTVYTGVCLYTQHMFIYVIDVIHICQFGYFHRFFFLNGDLPTLINESLRSQGELLLG